MTKSYRKTPLRGFTTSESDKWWKQLAARRLRRRVKLLLIRGWYDVVGELRSREVTCSFTDPKDGKMWIDAGKYPELMRK